MFCCLKKSQEEEELDGMMGDLDYWKQISTRDTFNLPIEVCLQHNRLFKDNMKKDSETMDLTSYRNMLGAIGQTYIGERLFAVICPEDKSVITLKDYLNYQDILYNGTVAEKNRN